MNKNIDKYTYKVFYSTDDAEFVGSCLEFPSLSWLDKDPIKALKGIRNLVSDIIDELRKEGEYIPEPIEMKKYSGKFIVRTLPDYHKNLIIKAKEQGVSLNQYVNNKLMADA